MESNIDTFKIKFPELYVTYVTPQYFENLYVFMLGMEKYSDVAICVYVFNKFNRKNKITKLPTKFNIFTNLIIKYINSNEGEKYLKYVSMVDSINQFRHKYPKLNYIFIHFTTVPNKSIDYLFVYSDDVKNVPYISIHPTYLREKNKYKNLEKAYGVPFNKHVGCSKIIWYNQSCYEIIKQGYLLIKANPKINFKTSVNYLQVLNGLKDNFHLMRIPYEWFDKFINKEDPKDFVFDNNKMPEYHERVSFYGFFGMTNERESQKMLDNLIEFNNINSKYSSEFTNHEKNIIFLPKKHKNKKTRFKSDYKYYLSDEEIISESEEDYERSDSDKTYKSDSSDD